MNYQQYMIEQTRAAAEEAFRNAKAVPAEKLTWQAADTSRSVLDICRELAQCPKWAEDIIRNQEPEWNEETMAAIKKEAEQWSSVEACQEECNRRLSRLFELYGEITDEQLKNTKWLPYDGGRDFTVKEMMDYPRWNFNWHSGQIAFIQTLYGDKAMY